MLNIFITFLFFLLLISPILKSKNFKEEYLNLAQNNLPKSRFLIDSQIKKIENKVHIKKINNKSKLEKDKQKKNKIIKKIEKKKNYKFKINFMPEEEKPSAEEIKIFYDNMVNFNKKDSITIKGFAQKRENDSTSKVRRLSLKRALFFRTLLIQENYNISQIYIKALGHDNNLKGNKDIVVINKN